MVTRRTFLASAAGLAAGAALPAPRVHGLKEDTVANPSRPNILFVFADQLRAQSLGYVGQEAVATPFLDRFAAEGAAFSNAVSNCPL